MRRFNKNLTLVALFLFATVFIATNAFATWEQNYSSGYRYYTSMTLVNDLGGDVSSITPAIDNDKIPYGDADDYLSSSSCLGYNGPLGPYGPLGTLGPIGSDTWSYASYWINAAWSWSSWWDEIDGPMGPDGPLGEDGPVAPNQYYGVDNPGYTTFSTNDFARHSRALGVWTPLGPIGPLGALGALGPLGPVGAHGYSTNANGEYLSGGNVVRTYTMWFDSAQTIQRTYELYEKYPESFAESKNDNDTSFMVTGISSSYQDIDTYSFTSASNQVVTIVLVPEYTLDDFDLTITDSSNNTIEVSNEGTSFVDWVQLKVPANTTIKAKVQCYWSGHYLDSSYRLYVTGSTVNLNQTEISGDHVSDW